MIDISLTISEVILGSVLIVIIGAIIKPRVPGKWKTAVLPSVLIGIAVISAVGAATSLSISGTGSVTAKNWKVLSPIQVGGTAPTCSAGTYADTASITWGNVGSPSTTNAYICVQNADAATQSYTASSTINPNSGVGTISTSPSGATPVLAGGFSLVTVTLTINTGVAGGTTFSTSTSIS